MTNGNSGSGGGGKNLSDTSKSGKTAIVPGGFGGGSAVAPSSNPLEALYTSALKTQAGDYDSIMQQYRDLSTKPITSGTPFTPTPISYTTSPEFQKSMANFENMSQTGGYSDQDKQDIRARAISPIRSIYAQGQQNLSRQRALQGGYSPSYNATSARMARDVSSQVGDITTNVNAQLAQMIAEGKRAGSAGYAAGASQKEGILNEIARLNAENKTRAAEINSARELDVQKTNASQNINSIEGQKSLYGTTPALTSLFGNQALEALRLMSANSAAGAVPPQIGQSGKGAAVTPRYPSYGTFG